MAYGYRRCDRDQLFLLPPSMRDWLPEGHLALFLIDAVSLLDTAAFHEVHPNDGAGRPAYDPDMMLTLLLYAYATGMRSSRAVEAACVSDLACKVICANEAPDHGTIARFRADNEETIKDVFVQVLKLCARAGLASLGQIAIDGTKIGSDAALDKNRSLGWVRSEIDKILSAAEKTDESEDEAPPLFGTVVPEPLAAHGTRLARLQAALLEGEAQAEARRAEEAEGAEKARSEAETGRKLPGRKPKDPHAALQRAEADLKAAQVKAERNPRRKDLAGAVATAEAATAAAREAAAEAPPPALVVNVTDPESRMMKTQGGWVQGFNVQASVNERQVVVAYSATKDHNDVNQIQPMIENTEETARAAGIEEEIGLLTADAGYWSEENATSEGPDRLIATTKDWKQRRAARELGNTSGPPPEDATPLEAMEHRLRTEEGRARTRHARTPSSRSSATPRRTVAFAASCDAVLSPPTARPASSSLPTTC